MGALSSQTGSTINRASLKYKYNRYQGKDEFARFLFNVFSEEPICHYTAIKVLIFDLLDNLGSLLNLSSFNENNSAFFGSRLNLEKDHTP